MRGRNRKPLDRGVDRGPESSIDERFIQRFGSVRRPRAGCAMSCLVAPGAPHRRAKTCARRVVAVEHVAVNPTLACRRFAPAWASDSRPFVERIEVEYVVDRCKDDGTTDEITGCDEESLRITNVENGPSPA